MSFGKTFHRLKGRYVLRAAVKEALNNLPSAVCYFPPFGTIKLCNAAMYDLYRRMTQSDLQSLSELHRALESCDAATGIIRDGDIFLFPDGRAWQYSQGSVTTAEGTVYTEAVFSDVTEVYEKRLELRRQSRELKKMFRELKLLSDNVLEMTREQEILNLKLRLHDQMSMGVAAIRQILRQNTVSEENAAAIAQFRMAVQVLWQEAVSPGDAWSEFLQEAEIAGVRVELQGTLPQEESSLRLLLALLREACTNAVRHAGATVLYVDAQLSEDIVTLRVTNDGAPPTGEVIPRGGLANLKREVIKIGGSMEIASHPTFLLTVTLPLGKTVKEEHE